MSRGQLHTLNFVVDQHTVTAGMVNSHLTCNPSARRRRQEDYCESKANLSYITRPCLKKEKKNH